MASNITHYVFGKRIVDTLPPEARAVIRTYPKHFLIGNQGPDLFFYHVTSTRHQVGPFIHKRPFDDLLFRNRAWIASKPTDTPTWTYLLGLLCHFSLDIAFHPYIDHIEPRISLDHVTIEREFDRYLLRQAGIPFGTFSEYTMIPHPEEVAEAIVPVYETYSGVDIHDIRQALYAFRIAMVFFHVNSKSARKRKLRALSLLGLDDDLGGMLMSTDKLFESTYITNLALHQHMQLAYPIAEEAVRAIYGDEADYPPFFRLNFSGQ
ncbi:MAG: zinc dependent phospholipase C family protein [Peptoniphilus sp.]|nr:zinc dependent phospholipase C family protein [Peptoniphilus sp.]MDD7362768.1 zinc dependent phospholipase C family protein [Bacillota bacterium]MDY6044536.1 zinc dependent phospholipase C family protein [Peptoniphilus sp.]